MKHLKRLSLVGAFLLSVNAPPQPGVASAEQKHQPSEAQSSHLLSDDYLKTVAAEEEKDLILSIRQARKVYGPASKIAFERLLLLADLYLKTGRPEKVVDLTIEFREAFPKLIPQDQRYFAPLMLNKAETLAKEQNYSSAETLYLPILQASGSPGWINTADVGSEMSSLARLLKGKHRVAESEPLFAASWRILKHQKQSSRMRLQAIQDLARVHSEMKDFDAAEADYEELLADDELRADEQWTNVIENWIDQLSDQKQSTLLEALALKLAPLYSELKTAEGIDNGLESLSGFINGGEISVAKTLFDKLLVAYAASSTSESRYPHPLRLDQAAQAAARAGQPEVGLQFYDRWVAAVKKKNGANSAEALRAIQSQLRFMQNQKMQDASEALLTEVGSDASTPDVAARLERIRLLQKMDRQQPDKVITALNAVLKPEIPLTTEGARIYFEAAQVYRWLGRDDEPLNTKAFSIVVKLLPQNKSYLGPGIMLLAKGTNDRSRSLDRCMSELLSALSRTSDVSSSDFDDLVYRSLRYQGRITAAMQVRADTLRNLAGRRKDLNQLRERMKSYVREQMTENGAHANDQQEPDPRFVKQAFQIVIEAALLDAFKQALSSSTVSGGKVVAVFDVDKDGIANVKIDPASNGGETRIALVRKSFNDIKDLNDVLLGFGKIKFQATFDYGSKNVTVLPI